VARHPVAAHITPQRRLGADGDKLERVARGLYGLPGAAISEHRSLAAVSARVPTLLFQLCYGQPRVTPSGIHPPADASSDIGEPSSNSFQSGEIPRQTGLLCNHAKLGGTPSERRSTGPVQDRVNHGAEFLDRVFLLHHGSHLKALCRSAQVLGDES